MAAGLNTSSLRQAREARKLSLVDVCEFTRISDVRLRRFEAGEAEPSFSQLGRLGDLYNVPVYAFFSDNPVKFELTLPDFRKATPSAASLSPRGLSRLWQVERSACFVEDLIVALGHSAPKFANILRITNSPSPSAAELRNDLDVWLAERRDRLKIPGRDEEAFLKFSRLYLETRGCLSAINSAPSDDYLGFYNEITPRIKMIFVNREVTNAKRRLFTFAHEIAHFIFGTEGISDPFVARNSEERRCNAFAAEFLAPEEVVFSVLEKARAPRGSDVIRLVDFISRETFLSRQASTLRLEELGVITRTAASRAFAYLRGLKRPTEVFQTQKAASKPMGRSVAVGKKLSEVGVYSAYIASLAVEKKAVDVVDVERGLGISEKLQPYVFDLAKRRFEASAG